MIGTMLADSTDFKRLEGFITDPKWVFEQKADGNRVLLSASQPGPGVLITRNGTIYSKKVPQAMRDFAFTVAGALDGELVGEEFWLFDIPLWGSTIVSGMALDVRRRELEKIFASGIFPACFRLVPQARDEGQKRLMHQLALTHGWEGLMVKYTDSPYRAGRSPVWLKAKQTQTADVIVIEVGKDGKDAATLAAVDPIAGKAIEVGRCSLIGKPKVKPMDVVEVKYLYLGANGRLYQPTLMRVRDDKGPLECFTTQFRHVNKAMLDVLPLPPTLGDDPEPEGFGADPYGRTKADWATHAE